MSLDSTQGSSKASTTLPGNTASQIKERLNDPNLSPAATVQAETTRAQEAAAAGGGALRSAAAGTSSGAGGVEAIGLDAFRALKDGAYRVASQLFGNAIYPARVQRDWQRLLDAMDAKSATGLSALAKQYQRDVELDGLGAGTSGAGPAKVRQARRGAAQLGRFASQALDLLFGKPFMATCNIDPDERSGPAEATYVAVQGPSADLLQNDVLEYFKRTKSIPRVSLIQRAFRLGPHRALRIMQDLVQAGLVKERPTTRGAMYSVVKHRDPTALGMLRA